MSVGSTKGLARIAPRENENQPAWLRAIHRTALDWVSDQGFPGLQDEDWKYTRVGPILDIPFEQAVSGMPNRLSLRIIDEIAGNFGGPRLVFVNGYCRFELSSLRALPEGTTVTRLASVLTQDDEHLAPLLFPAEHNAFTALNTALAEDGAFIQLPSHTTVDRPIHLVCISDTGTTPLVSNPRSLILAGAGSRMTIVQTYIGLHGREYCTNAVTEVLLEEGAHVEHYTVQNEATTAVHIALLNVRQRQGSTFSSHVVSLGASMARHEVRVGLEAEGAEVSLTGLFMPRATQHHSHSTTIEHAAPHCSSHELYKGVLDGHSRGVFKGRVIVRPHADGTDASQTNQNLLLSAGAEVDTRPQLEIHADDVKCTHGAAVGQLDEEAIFYLCSRGIAYQSARDILTEAFVAEMMQCIQVESLRTHVEQLVASHLGVGGGKVRI